MTTWSLKTVPCIPAPPRPISRGNAIHPVGRARWFQPERPTGRGLRARRPGLRSHSVRGRNLPVAKRQLQEEEQRRGKRLLRFRRTGGRIRGGRRFPGAHSCWIVCASPGTPLVEFKDLASLHPNGRRRNVGGGLAPTRACQRPAHEGAASRSPYNRVGPRSAYALLLCRYSIANWSGRTGTYSFPRPRTIFSNISILVSQLARNT